MANVAGQIKQLIAQLTADRKRLDDQIDALQLVLKRFDGTTRAAAKSTPHVAPKRRRMSAALRKAVSQRMKAYWVKRRAAEKGKTAAAGQKKG